MWQLSLAALKPACCRQAAQAQQLQALLQWSLRSCASQLSACLRTCAWHQASFSSSHCCWQPMTDPGRQMRM